MCSRNVLVLLATTLLTACALVAQDSGNRRANPSTAPAGAETTAPKTPRAPTTAPAVSAKDSRTVEIVITGMDYDTWKDFKADVEKIRGVDAVQLKDISESVATVDVEYEFTEEVLADRIGSAKDVKLKVIEIAANRIKAKVAKD